MKYNKYDGGKVKLNQEIRDWLKSETKQRNTEGRTDCPYEFFRKIADEIPLTEDELLMMAYEVEKLQIQHTPMSNAERESLLNDLNNRVSKYLTLA